MSEAKRVFAERYASCRVEPVRHYIGDQLDEALLARIERESGATIVRLIEPGTSISSMEGVPGRLSIAIDRERRILHFGCE